jgi:hypothetical protein
MHGSSASRNVLKGNSLFRIDRFELDLLLGI